MSSGHRPWSWRLLLLAPILVGGALRFHQAWSYYDVYSPDTDQEEGYYGTGIGLLSCHVLSVGIPDVVPRSWRGPLYPTFIAVVEGAFRRPWPGHVRMAQAFLSTVEIGLVFLLGEIILSPMAGFLAATWAAVDTGQIEAVSTLNVHGFYAFCMLAVLIAVLKWLETRSPRATVVLGFALAASLLCRSAHFLLPIFLCAAYAFWWRFPERPWKTIALLAASTALFLSPLTLRNAIQFKKLLPADGYAAASDLLAATQGAYKSVTVDQAVDIADSIEPGFRSLGLRGDELYAAMVKLAMRNIVAHPLAYAGFCLERLFMFWGALAVPLILGAFALWANPKNKRLQAAALVCLSFSGYAFVKGGSPVYRAPVLPLLSLLAGCGLASALTLASRADLGGGGAAKDRGLDWSLRAVLYGLAPIYAAMLAFLALELGQTRLHRFHLAVEPQHLCPDQRVLDVLRLEAVHDQSERATESYVVALLQRAAHRAESGDENGRASDIRDASSMAALCSEVRMSHSAKLVLQDLAGAAAKKPKIVWPAIPRPSAERITDGLLQRAQSAVNGDRLQDALSLADKAVTVAARASLATHARARAERAQVELLLRDYKSAESDLRSAAFLEPRPGGQYAMPLALVLSREGKTAQALELLEAKAPPSEGSDRAARARRLVWRAVLRFELKKNAAAISDLEEAIKLDAPTACKRDPEVEEADRIRPGFFDLCAARYPSDARLRLDRGVARYAAGDAPGAEADFREALRLKPGYLEAAMSLASVLERRGAVSEALAVVQGSLRDAGGRAREAIYADARSLETRLSRRNRP